MVNGLTPPYLGNLLAPRQGQSGRYPTRREHSLIPIRAKSTKYYNSFIPSSVRKWNTLDITIKSATSLDSFKRTLKKSMFKNTTGRFYNKSKGKASVNHTRIRLGLSALKHQLYTYGIVAIPTCTLCNNDEDETPMHYLLECSKHAACRQDLLSRLRPTMDRLDIDINNTQSVTELITRGHLTLSVTDNIALFHTVQDYITQTKRF
jgi:hypothetical protein